MNSYAIYHRESPVVISLLHEWQALRRSTSGPGSANPCSIYRGAVGRDHPDQWRCNALSTGDLGFGNITNDAALIMSLESVFAVLFGWIFLRETLLPIQIAGCIFILAAVVLVQAKNGKMRAT